MENTCSECGRDIHTGEEFYDIAHGLWVKRPVPGPDEEIGLACLAAYCLDCIDRFHLGSLDLPVLQPMADIRMDTAFSDDCLICRRRIEVGERQWTLWLDKYGEKGYGGAPREEIAAFCICMECGNKVDHSNVRLKRRALGVPSEPRTL